MKTCLAVLLVLCSFCVSSQNGLNPYAGFLDQTPNARINAFGEIGAVSPNFYKDAGLHQNPALLFKTSGNYAGLSRSFMPSSFDDMFIRDLDGYVNFNKTSSIGFNIRKFDYGKITFTDQHGSTIGVFNPTEVSYQLTYSHSINENFSLGAGMNYFKSDLVCGVSVAGRESKAVKSYAMDLGLVYEKSEAISDASNLIYSFGGSISNFGPKISYSNDDYDKQHIGTKLRLGFIVNPDFYLSDEIRLNASIAYQAEKFLIPTPPIYAIDSLGLPIYDANGNWVITSGKDPSISAFRALYQSFYDAPGGMKEEIQEVIHKLGNELRFSYENKAYLALRSGYILEHKKKGNRKMATRGIGIGAFGFTVDYYHYKLNETWPWAITFGFRSNLGELMRF